MRQFFDAETVVTAIKGIVGVSATGGGFYVSILPKVEAWLRVSSLFIGCAVGIATLVSILRKQRTKSGSAATRSNNHDPKNQS